MMVTGMSREVRSSFVGPSPLSSSGPVRSKVGMLLLELYGCHIQSAENATFTCEVPYHMSYFT